MHGIEPINAFKHFAKTRVSYILAACIGDPSQRRITCELVLGHGGVIVVPRTLNLRPENSGALTGAGRTGAGGVVSGTGASRPPGTSDLLPKHQPTSFSHLHPNHTPMLPRK